MALIRHISFVDCPGHDVLMATMLNGTAVMDAALLVIAANEPCPRPQTSEHLAAVQIMNLKNLIIFQNKVDLVRPEEALEQYGAILRYTATTAAEGAPIIPISAQLGYGIPYAVEHIVKTIPAPKRDYNASPRMIVIRSFDVNKPGRDVRQLEGGVAGGSILQGCLRVGQEVEIRPGVSERTKDRIVCRVRRARIVSLKAENNSLQFAVPGGLIGVGLTLDPSTCRADRLAGQVIGLPGNLPDVYIQLTVCVTLFQRLLGVQSEGQVDTRIQPLRLGEVLMVNVGSISTGGVIKGLQSAAPQATGQQTYYATFHLKDPVCTSVEERIALSRKMEDRWRLVGWAVILKGETVQLLNP
jgi:translation initiation factor 2 gamma subunit (eIF-2gamma)